MVRLTLVRAVDAEPPEVIAAYRQWILSEGASKPGETGRSGRALADGRLQFSRTGETRAGTVRVDGVVSFESAEAWSCRREIELNGRPYARESERYFLTNDGGLTELTVDYEMHARTILHEFLLDFGRGRLLRERSRELDRWLPGVPSRIRRVAGPSPEVR